MPASRVLAFSRYRLDLEEDRLWRGDEEVALKPRAFAILRYLASHPRRLVGKGELETAVWGGARVSPATMRSALRELRDVLAEDGGSGWIETVRGRGYRFAAEIDGAADSVPPASEAPALPRLVGREPAQRRLREWRSDALAARRRLGFVTGEPGIGKTALVDAFLAELEAGDVLCGRGQCISRHGDREPYRPMLEALTSLCRQPAGRGCLDHLRRYAPTWLVEMPGVVEPAEMRRLEASAFRVNQDRMLRELADALAAICSDRVVVLVLEDLHWSDGATLDVLELLARRTEPAHLLIVGTHRPVAQTSGGGSRLAEMRAELHLHGLCADLPLHGLAEGEVRAYLDGRFPGRADLDRLSAFVFARSEGNPLFMVSYADEMVRSGALAAAEKGADAGLESLGIPFGLREMVEHQIEQLSAEERAALEGASVAGVDFDVEVAATAFQDLCPQLDAHLARIARGRGLLCEHERGRLRFVHALYQEVLYERLPVLRKKELHRALGLALEGRVDASAAPLAAELSMHFERGGDVERSVRYGLQAADAAIQRSAHHEAAELLRQTRPALDRFPNTDERPGVEVELLAKLANCLSITKGYTDPEVGETFRLAYERSSSLESHTPEIMTALAGLCGFYVIRAEHGTAHEIGLQQMELAARSDDPFDLVAASVSLSASLFSTGRYEEAIPCLEAGIAAYDPALHRPGLTPPPNDQGVQAMAQLAVVLATVGRIDEARERSEQADSLARELDHVPSLALAHFYSMLVYHGLGEWDAAARVAAECLQLSLENGFPYYIPAAMIISGSTRVRQGDAAAGLDSIEQGVALFRGVGAELGVPHYLALLGEARGEAGDIGGGLACVQEGLEMVERTGEVSGEAELYFAEGHLRSLRHDGDAAERERIEMSFRNGVDSAARLGGRTTGLRPALRLARLWSEAGRDGDARRLVEKSREGFDDSHDTPLLREATELLASLG